MEIKAWICKKIPFCKEKAFPLELFYPVDVNVNKFSVKVYANNSHCQKIRFINLFHANVKYSYTIHYKNGNLKKVINSSIFSDTFFIEINEDKQMKEIIYNFTLDEKTEFPFQVVLNAINI